MNCRLETFLSFIFLLLYRCFTLRIIVSRHQAVYDYCKSHYQIQGCTAPGVQILSFSCSFRQKNLNNNSTFGSWHTPQKNSGSTTESVAAINQINCTENNCCETDVRPLTEITGSWICTAIPNTLGCVSSATVTIWGRGAGGVCLVGESPIAIKAEY